MQRRTRPARRRGVEAFQQQISGVFQQLVNQPSGLWKAAPELEGSGEASFTVGPFYLQLCYCFYEPVVSGDFKQLPLGQSLLLLQIS